MCSWPAPMESLLQSLASNSMSKGESEGTTGLPDVSAMELSLAQEAQLVCNMLDIPVRPGHRVEALHMLFTLFTDFRQNEHFAHHVRGCCSSYCLISCVAREHALVLVSDLG